MPLIKIGNVEIFSPFFHKERASKSFDFSDSLNIETLAFSPPSETSKSFKPPEYLFQGTTQMAWLQGSILDGNLLRQ